MQGRQVKWKARPTAAEVRHACGDRDVDIYLRISVWMSSGLQAAFEAEEKLYLPQETHSEQRRAAKA